MEISRERLDEVYKSMKSQSNGVVSNIISSDKQLCDTVVSAAYMVEADPTKARAQVYMTLGMNLVSAVNTKMKDQCIGTTMEAEDEVS